MPADTGTLDCEEALLRRKVVLEFDRPVGWHRWPAVHPFALQPSAMKVDVRCAGPRVAVLYRDRM